MEHLTAALSRATYRRSRQGTCGQKVGLTHSCFCWSNHPTFDAELIDMQYISQDTSGEQIQWDITEAARKWAEGTLGNNGVMLKLRNEILTSSGYATFYSSYSGYANSQQPMIAVSYSEIKGVESHYGYYEISADAAGTVLVGSFNRHLSLLHDSISTTDEILPYTFGLTYNSYMINRYYGSTAEDHVAFTSSATGKGFKLYTEETVIETTIDGIQFYIWNDSNGSDHYFSYDSSSEKYVNEEGMQLHLVETSEGKYQIRDDFGNVKEFNSAGLLIAIYDAFGNKRDEYVVPNRTPRPRKLNSRRLCGKIWVHARA